LTDEKKRRRNKLFAEAYPDNSLILMRVTDNPKKEGTKAAQRFTAYKNANTVGEFLKNGGMYRDLANDIGRQFIRVIVL